jgi:hypothetical protein
MRKTLFWIFNEKEMTYKKVGPANDDQKSNQNISSDLIVSKKKCSFCNRCENCECELTKEKEIKDKEKEFQLDLSAVNYFAFFDMFIFIFTCNITIWLMIGM